MHTTHTHHTLAISWNSNLQTLGRQIAQEAQASAFLCIHLQRLPLNSLTQKRWVWGQARRKRKLSTSPSNDPEGEAAIKWWKHKREGPPISSPSHPLVTIFVKCPLHWACRIREGKASAPGELWGQWGDWRAQTSQWPPSGATRPAVRLEHRVRCSAWPSTCSSHPLGALQSLAHSSCVSIQLTHQLPRQPVFLLQLGKASCAPIQIPLDVCLVEMATVVCNN